jgi:hypothetical protein
MAFGRPCCSTSRSPWVFAGHAALAGLIVSGIVLALQVLLQPGEVVKGGVAAGKTILVTLAGKP